MSHTERMRTLERLFLLLLTLLAAPLALALDESELLDVEKAFALQVTASERNALELKFDIADGYYMYRERIKVEALDGTFALDPLVLPPGKKKVDEFFGEVETYRGSMSAVLTGTAPPGTERVKLRVKSQGCADAGICYPPHAQTIEVELPAETGASPVLSGSGSGPVAASAAPTSALPSASPFGETRDLVPLPEEEAFKFEAIATPDDGILARFTMPKGYYLYRDKTSFEAKGTPAVTLGVPRWPKGVDHEDDHFGKVVVYFDTIDVPVPLTAAEQPSVARKLAITAKFQGCQLDGICYPPMQQTVDLELPAPAGFLAANAAATSAVMEAAPAPEVERSEQDRIADELRSGNKLTALFVFLLYGLLLAFTPCVLPMIPILSGIIAGAGENLTTRRALWLSTVYVLATALVFTIAGVVAGLAGQNLQAALQKPAVLVAFAGVFIALALSMFGFYELQMPAWLQNRVNAAANRQQGGSVAGVAIMGLLSALLVGPCVAPPLAGAVLYISQQRDPVFGGAALFMMALGMGAPLIVFGASAGRLMPRAGAWMDTVKVVFGVVFLWLALWMLERVLDPVWIMLLAGILLVDSSVRLGALDHLPQGASGWRKTAKGLGVALLVLGVLEFIGVAAGSRDYLRPLQGLRAAESGAAAHEEAPFRSVSTPAELDAALAASAAAGKPVLFDFYADWCVECKRMEKYTFTDAAVLSAFGAYTLLKIDVTDQTPEHIVLQQRFEIIGPPATLFFDCNGGERRAARLIGFEEAAAFAERLRKAASCT